MTPHLDAGISAMACKLITRGWSTHSTALRVLFNMATVPDKTTGDLQTASPGLCGGHYNGGWAACPHSVKTVSWQRELRKARTDVWVCKSASISVSRESGSGSEAAIIGDTHKSTESIGDMKRATRSTDGAAFWEQNASSLSRLHAEKWKLICLREHMWLMFLTEPSSTSCWPR